MVHTARTLLRKMHGLLDHVVLLIPYDNLINPPAWLTDNFTLSPGGRHGDNKTENRLVLFKDGSYLEVIAFINDDPDKRKGHWWDKPYGVVDYALTTKDSLSYEDLVDRLKKSETGISYAEPKEGGRSTGGKDIRWRVTFPTAVERGKIPFFCEDTTDRKWRVAITDENTTHPCGALGVAAVLLEVKKQYLDKLTKANAAALDMPKGSDAPFEIGTVNEVKKLKHPAIRLQEASEDSKHDLALTLVLQTGDDKPAKPICEHIGDGLVNITFE